MGRDAAVAAKKLDGEEAKLLAAAVAKRSIWLAGAMAAGLVVVPAAGLGWASGKIAASVLLALAEAAGLAALAFSALLRFDAALFAFMASHGDEISGGMRVDEFLARAGLKAEPAVIRRLAERAAGTKRFQKLQFAALGGFAACALLMFLALSF